MRAFTPRIGIGVTTCNRHDVVAHTVAEIERLTPDAVVVVIDDASAKPVERADYRFDDNVGIAAAKNKCMELLVQAGCDELFLFDDDAYPLVEEWWRPYVESPEPHLMRIFPDRSGPHELHRDDRHVAFSDPRGVMLYAHRSVLDVAGGMDLGFGRWGYEHGDWSCRIHAFGMTTWRFADVIGSERLIYCLDEHGKVARVVDRREREHLVKVNVKRYEAQYDSPIRYDFHQPRDVVITSLFTGRPDPQRRTRMPADVAMLADLRTSLQRHDRPLVVLHDELDAADDEHTTFVAQTVGAQPYFQRWISTYQYLRAHPEIRWVWCVDGTDVEMLRDPFLHMQHGRLYLGSEHQVVGCAWMRRNHRADSLVDFLDSHQERQLLNAGLVGGDRVTVMRFLHRIVRYYHDNMTDRFFRRESRDLGVGDMAAFNRVAYEQFADRLVFGPQVNTVFKAEQRNEFSWWRHK